LKDNLLQEKDIIIDIPKLTSKECYDWNKNKHINPITGKRLLETDPLYKELDKICNFCNKVVTIPQYLGTCWFNAMLMSILYSQYSRKLLLHDNIYANEKTNKLYKIINRILTKTYISKERALRISISNFEPGFTYSLSSEATYPNKKANNLSFTKFSI
jgi:hypothetical protein